MPFSSFTRKHHHETSFTPSSWASHSWPKHVPNSYHRRSWTRNRDEQAATSQVCDYGFDLSSGFGMVTTGPSKVGWHVSMFASNFVISERSYINTLLSCSCTFLGIDMYQKCLNSFFAYKSCHYQNPWPIDSLEERVTLVNTRES